MFEKCFPTDLTPETLSPSCAQSGIDAAIDCSFSAVTCLANETLFYSLPLTVGEGAAASTHAVPLILIWLAVASIFFTLYFGFINFRYFTYAIRVLFKKYDEPNAPGELTNFQSLAASLSGTVGLGNIAGVAVAVSLGGPGAVLWMVVMGLLGMSTKFVEVTAGVKYRRMGDKDSPHSVYGGPIYYVRDAFENKGIPYIGAFLSVVFAVSCIMGALGGGNMFQANQSLEQVVRVTGGEASFFIDKGWLFGLILAVLVGMVIIGGIRSIGRVAATLVPLMAIIYLSACAVVIAMHYADIPGAFAVIFRDAFTPEAGIGGVIGGILVGVQRASFSNESGLGSAAIVQCTAKTEHPVRQGFVGMLGPFIDTVVVCMMTALLIVVTGAYEGGQGISGVELTSRAMESGGAWLSYVLAVAVFLFAYSTLITWFYYGEIGMTYLLGEKKWVSWLFKFIFLGFIIIGCSAKLENVVNLSDAMFLSMGIPNIIGLYLLAPIIRKDLKEYIARLKAKEFEP